MKVARQAAGFALAACALLMGGGCVTRGPLLDASTRIVELDETPFFPQTAHQCGPAALATLLGASQVAVTPDTLESQVYIPARRGSLQIEMLAAPRRHGRLSYRLAPNLDAIVAELDVGRPVLVLHNYGLPFWPRWHYAVVVGYIAQRDQLVLRSGKVRRQVISTRNFMRAWANAGRWAMVLLRPGETPTAADRERYLEAAAAFELVATPADTRAAFTAAVELWPGDSVALLGRGTAWYKSGDWHRAADDYDAALAVDANNVAAHNNLAMTKLLLGCPQSAQQQLANIKLDAISGALREAVADTKAQINAKREIPDHASCSITAGWR